MAITWIDTLRHALLDAYETHIGASPEVRIYSGAVPAKVSTALSGNTLLAKFPLAADWMAAAGSNEKTFNGLPLSTTGEAGAGAGTNATFYRIYNTAGTVAFEQGTVGLAAATPDMTLDSTNITSGQTVRITAWKKIGPHA